MNKDNTISLRLDNEGVKEIEELIKYFEKQDYGIKLNKSSILNIALDRMYRELIEKQKLML